MMRLLTCCLLLLPMTFALAVQPGEILPSDGTYDSSIPTPKSYFGFKVGERHLYHHELVGYFQALAEASDRVTILEYARSYGQRPLIVGLITAPRNHARLDEIRTRHAELAAAESSVDVETESLPAVINMGYSVHGNEPSAGNAAPLVAYHLAAAVGEEHERLLDETVVLIDPCLNPDGFERFAHWANNHRGKIANADPNHREHNEPSPNGRTNYYWFDLNRDWLPVVHPESKGRIALFHHWKPNVVLDFHEMGTDSTYFFQPGVKKRNHPLTPQGALKLTRQFAEYHAKALDRVGSLYYTEERFDDFYMGKGSTYPDLHGAIGILFEQASARGHIQESLNGELSFAFAIRNHFLTSLSSLKATLDRRKDLLEYQRTFYKDAVALARNDNNKGYVVTAPNDALRLDRFLEVLERHQIHAFLLKNSMNIDGNVFAAGQSYFIPTAQPEYRFLTALFERRTEFEENVFYDVSTWTLPLAFNIRFAELSEPPIDDQLGAKYSSRRGFESKLELDENDLAYVIDWRGYAAPKALHQLLAANVIVKVATEPFGIQQAQNEKYEFPHGTLLVPLGIQPDKQRQIANVVSQATTEGVSIHSTSTGLTPSGIDLGSGSFLVVEKPKVLLLTGSGVRGYEAGEVWHYLDRRLEMPLTMVDDSNLESVDLDEYSCVVMVSGKYGSISPSATKNIQRYVDDGGTLIAIGSAIRWIDASKTVEVAFRKSKIAQHTQRRPYAEAANDAAFKLVRGSIFQASVDSTHPLGYGFSADPLPIFRNNNVFLEPSKDAYSTPILYSDDPLLSGYVSNDNLELLGGSASVVVRERGRGRVILIAENPNFRGFWYGTNRIFANALFFGPLTEVPTGDEPRSPNNGHPKRQTPPPSTETDKKTADVVLQ